MPMSPGFRGDSEVYFLPLTEVPLPLSKQPQSSRSVHLQKSTDFGRHSLLYLKEIGHGWFGKVFLGEVSVGLDTNQVVVKELKASASVQEQMHFLEEAQPYRALQHPGLLQCLAQRTEVTPYLLVMEFCPLGDVKGYLRSCRATESIIPEPLILQRMACNIASGLLHMHKHNFTHSDLALRNCLLTADVSVKIGDYGLAHTKYRDDYHVTSDQVHVPLRWIAPELLDEVQGDLQMANQTPPSNIWSLGVTIWELFELANQPYRHYSDRQVLSYTIKEQQLKLAKPLLKVPLAERWYEVMQFCWLQPEQRPTAEEVHLLLSYLCAKGASEVEEDFERRWNSLRPTTGGHHGHNHGTSLPSDRRPPSSPSASSFPLLEQFSGMGEGYQSESGDDILTVTETSHGLNFEYKWEQARAEQHYQPAAHSDGLGHHRCHDEFYPPGGIVGGCPMEGIGASPSYYQTKHLHAPGVVPVLSAHSPSLGNEYYIRIEEPGECNIQLDYDVCSYSPDYQGSSGSFLTGSAESGECMSCPSQANNMGSYWSADIHKADLYDSQDSSPAISLTMEPLLGQVSDSSPLTPWVSGHYVSYKEQDGGYYYEPSPPLGMDHRYLIGDDDLPVEPLQESWGSRSLRQALGELEHPLRVPPVFNTSPQQAYGEPYLDSSQSSVIGRNVTGGYYDMMGSLRKTMPSHTNHTRHGTHSLSIDMEMGGALFIGHRDSDTEDEVDEEDVFLERHSCNTWPAKHGHGVLSRHRRANGCRQDSYVDFHYTMPSTDIEDSWPEENSLAFHSMPKPIEYLEPKDNSACLGLSALQTLAPSDDAYIYMCKEGETQLPMPGECCHSHFIDPLTGLLVRNYDPDDYVTDKVVETPNSEELVNLSPAPGGPVVIKNAPLNSDKITQTMSIQEPYIDLSASDATEKTDISANHIEYVAEVCIPLTAHAGLEKPETAHGTQAETESELSLTADSGVDRCGSSVSLIDILDCSDDDDDDGNDTTDDTTDVTSGIFADESSELTASPVVKSLQKPSGTPDSMDSMELLSVGGCFEGFALPPAKPTNSPRAMDSGYDTENNESPEFVPKEPHEPREPSEGKKATLYPSLDEEEEMEEEGLRADAVPVETNEQSVSEDACVESSTTEDNTLIPLSKKIPYRDSAYFSDYESERQSRDEGDEAVEIGREGETISDTECMVERNLDNTREEELEDLEALEMNIESNRATTLLCIEEDEHMEGSFQSSESELAELEEWPSQDENSSLGDWAAEVVGAMEEALGALGEERIRAEQEKELSSRDFLQDSEEAEEAEQTQSELAGGLSENSSTLAKDKMVALEYGTPRRFSSSSPPPPSSPLPSLPPSPGRATPGDAEDADKEDADSDDSEESDEELRSYSMQEQSGGEESEDECYPVPVIVSDTSDAHNLRSLLKVPSVTTPGGMDDALENKKKVVSFFDDVTVYLFDQESPTKELVEHGFLSGEDGRGTPMRPQEKVQAPSDDSSDGNVSEESAGYEWEDDFSLLPLPTSKMVSDSPPPPHSTPPPPGPQPAAKFSRFTVSPSSVSRFSITHVSDSDVDSA
ncbi:serine/threonine-protein kinase LMTK1 isoform X1 [Gadus macrocephalus]|uniref:serine/threonine-protein kinase LMTK1 isoform X1 n=1 Tax=Gadus macrocephalus TaxID=80720 RepID=UPI0028CB22F5|nr:serine/threonine-protein kinase LMTK1 isoform X1 [Gadus macrocephalus]XP_059893358.1 serine/threonine-protein kinase LMTK1 isoform X1 [Gadus macrocephalus]